MWWFSRTLRLGALAALPVVFWVRLAAHPSQALLASAALLVVGGAALFLHLTVGRRQGSPPPAWLAPVVGIGFFLIDLAASGEVSYAPGPIDRPDSVSVYANGFNTLSPALTGVYAHRWFVYLPLIGTAAAAIVAILLAVAIWMTLRALPVRRVGSTRVGLLGALPATLATPVACGPSLVSAFGAGAAGLVGALATPLLVLSATVLVVDIWWLRHISRKPVGGATP